MMPCARHSASCRLRGVTIVPTSLRDWAGIVVRQPFGLLRRSGDPIPRRIRSQRSASILALMAAAMLAGTAETENAVANGDTRTLSLIHEHTKESATITFKRDGRYDRAALDQLNWLLRDWREADATKMDPKLFDVVWEAQRSVGSSAPLRIVCGYRSPKTNGMLRRRSAGVAEFSQHMQGKAMDFFMTDASIDDIRAAGMRLQRGGVGWYPRSGSPFVHLDVGSVRSWPRMTHDQLTRLFPDGKTVHLPSDNRPLPRYEEARAEILSRGGTVLGYTAVAQADEIDDGPGLKGFLAGLFGGGAAAPAAAPAPAPVAATSRAKPVVAVASADPEDATGARRALGYAAADTLRGGASAQALLTGTMAGEAERIARTPLPPRRPAEFAAVAAAMAMPLPPARPVQVAGLGEAGLAGMANLSGATATPEFGAGDHPTHLRALFAAATTGARPARRDAPVRLALVQPRPDETLPVGDPFAGPSGAVLHGFSPASPGDVLAATHFTAGRN